MIDTPETCVECIFCQEYSTKSREYAYCYVTNGDSENDIKLIDCIYGYRQSKPDWCPLIELPKKKNWGEIFNGNVKGWNVCLREITGSQKINS